MACCPPTSRLIRRRPSRGFPRWISKWLGNCRSIEDLRVVGRRIDDARVAGRVDEMADDIGMLAGLAGGGATTRELLVAVRDRIGLGGAMEMLDGSKGSEATASHLDDLEALIQVADLHDEPGGFEPWLRASLESSAGGEGVRLATVHRVKGREWDRVAVFGANSGLLPHRLSESYEAERRVMHVAITRARHRCCVLADSERRSPFLAELRGEAAEAATKPALGAATLGKATARSRAEVDRGPAAPEASEADAALREWRTGAIECRRRARLRRDLEPPARGDRGRDAERRARAARLQRDRPDQAGALRRRHPRRARLGARVRAVVDSLSRLNP